MSRRRKPPSRSRPKALTARQRQQLNNKRPSIPQDHPDQAAEPLMTTRALGMRIRDAVRRAGVAHELERQIDGPASRRGPKRRISVEALLVAIIIAAYFPAKSYHRSAVVLALIGLDAAVAYDLGVCTTNKWENITYNTIARRIQELESTLLLGWFEGQEHRDFEWLSTRQLGASIPPATRRSITAAVLDETPRPMWARRTTVFENQAELERKAKESWRKENPELRVPTEGEEWIAMIEAEAIRLGYAVGPDGRLIHGKDPDARMGWATATSQLPAGHYVGYGLTLLVACQEALWSGDPYKLALGDDVPLYILAMSVKPAGIDSGPNGSDVVKSGRTNAPNLNDVTADRGYTPQNRHVRAATAEVGNQHHEGFQGHRPPQTQDHPRRCHHQDANIGAHPLRHHLAALDHPPLGEAPCPPVAPRKKERTRRMVRTAGRPPAMGRPRILQARTGQDHRRQTVPVPRVLQLL